MNKLKELRTSRNLYQKDVAAHLGVDRTTYVKYELGTSEPSFEILQKLADFYNVSIDYILGRQYSGSNIRPKGVKIPVLGIVPAGIPIEAIEEILDYEEIPEHMASTGEFFGLKIKGDSMMPRICDGDIVIVRKQPDVESGETAIIMVNGDEATCKKVVKQENGITLVPNNPAYDPRFFTNKEINSTPVRVIGKVVELRGKF